MAAATMAASMFAVDISSTVKMGVTAAKKNGDDIEFLALDKTNQKDNDALIFSGSSEKAGGQFQLWYQYDGENGEKVYTEEGSTNPWELGKSLGVHGLRIRNVNVWFKPLDNLKVTVGDTNLDSYKEHIFWWHGVYGAKPGSWGAFGGEYIAGNGFKAEFSPIDGLELTAVALPGAYTVTTDKDTGKVTTNPFISTAKDFVVKNYGIKAKVNLGAFADLPMTAAALFVDKGDQKYVAIGADYGNEWGGNFYAFANVSLNLNKDGLAGLAIDNAEYFVFDALKLQTHLPVVLYKEGDDMKVGLYATAKVSYALSNCTPYVIMSNNRDGDAGWTFDNFKFAMTVQPGVTFNVGSAGFDASLRLDIADSVNWSVPVAITVGL